MERHMSDQIISAAQTPEITAKQAAVILQFLQRTQMQGAEMPAYVDVFNVLSAIAATEPQESAEQKAAV